MSGTTYPGANPDCPNQPSQCRITREVATQEPEILWTVEVDGTGKQTNDDPNTYTATYQCSTCSMGWTISWTGSEAPIYKKL